MTDALEAAPGAVYHVRNAETLAGAISDTAKHRVDVVLLDLSLPDSRGLESLNRLREAAPTTPVIVLTGLDDDKVGVQLMEHDAQDYIVKDEASPKRLGRAIRFALQRTQATQEVQAWRERYTQWIQQSNEGLWDWDLVQGTATFSPGWCAMLELEPVALHSTVNTWFDLVLDDDALALANRLGEILVSDVETFTLEYRVRKPSGQVYWMTARGMVVRDAAGQAIRIAGSQHDTTDAQTNPCRACGVDNMRAASMCSGCGARLELARPSSESIDHAGGADIPRGTLIANQYEIEELIDVGSSGAVYVARDRDSDTSVALKVLHRWLLDTPNASHRFHQEGRVQTLVNHPNVVRVHDVGNDNGRDFIVMELVTGPTLREFMVSSDCPQDPLALIRMFLPLINGIDAVHAAGIIHRDIKPENILVVSTDDGLSLKMADFGVAKSKGSRTHTHTGAVIGTLQYMAPEQFVDAGTADRRADIYALGCNLYELLTRRPPFDYESEFRMMTAHLTEDAENPRDFNPLVSRALGEAVLGALAKDPDARYPDCSSLRIALIDAVAV